MTTEGEGILAVVVLGGLLVVAGLGVARASSSGHSIRETEQTDPISGLHWRRTSDPRHPAAPPRLVLAPGAPGAVEKRTPSPVCVRAGDRVLLRSGNATSAMLSLDATALASGGAGDRVRARVTVTGAAVEMTIAGPGHGVLLGKAEGWR